MTIAEVFGYVAAFFVFLTFSMKTMVPLRIVGICSNICFIIYGYLGASYPLLILHCALLPLNAVRLRQMLVLVRQVDDATRGDLNMDWLKPFSTTRQVQAGETLFRRGDVATHMLFVLSGHLRLEESGIELRRGDVVGELGLLSPHRTRTQSLECVESGELLQIGYDQVKQLYFQNPKFGFYFLQLSAGRLFQNIAKMEEELARYRAASAAGSAAPT